MPKKSPFYYPITEIKRFSTPQGRGSCYQQFASPGPHGNGANRFTVIFDEDIDFRVFERIDALFKLCKDETPKLVAVGERKGMITFVFQPDSFVPYQLQTDHADTTLADLSSDGDPWNVAVFRHADDEALTYLAHPPLSSQSYLEATTWHA